MSSKRPNDTTLTRSPGDEIVLFDYLDYIRQLMCCQMLFCQIAQMKKSAEKSADSDAKVQHIIDLVVVIRLAVAI